MVKIRLSKLYVEIETETNEEPQFLSLIDHVRGIHATRRKNIYRCSYVLLPDVLFYLRGWKSPDDIANPVAKAALAKELLRQERTKLLKEFGPDKEYENLWGHQSLGVELAEVNDRYNFFYDTRTGKTRMAYQIILNALRAGTAKRVLCLVPSSIISSWLEDAKEFPMLKVAAYYGTAVQKQRALTTPCHVMLWSEGMAVDALPVLKQIKFDICFFDESSKLKSHNSKISKAMLELSQYIPRWYNLSATPAPNGEHEYYTQMRLVDPYAFNPARTHFITKFFDNVSRNPKFQKLQINPDRKQEFMDIVESRSIYVDQSVMPTAGKEWHELYYQLPVDTFETYEDMRRNMASDVAGSLITAESAAAMRAKLTQLTSGFLMDTDAIHENKLQKKLGLTSERGVETYRIGSGAAARLNALQDLLQALPTGDKVVVWANYKEEFAMLRELFGDNARYIRGGTTYDEREEAIQRFKHGDLQYLVCHPLSVGMGINLVEAHHAVYFSISDSWEALKQSSERIYGHVNVQPNKCHYWVLLAETPDGKPTVDHLIYKNVSNKKDASTGFLDYLKAGYIF